MCKNSAYILYKNKINEIIVSLKGHLSDTENGKLWPKRSFYGRLQQDRFSHIQPSSSSNREDKRDFL